MKACIPHLLLASAAALSSGPARAQPATPAQSCVDVQVGSAQSYDCLNRQLAQDAQKTHAGATGPALPYDATSPSNVTGQFNESATRNRLGANFGHSVTPERPSPSYTGAFATPR
jgi:hypothetical protein